MFGFKKKGASDRVRIADRRIQHLRGKRAKTQDDTKKMKINKRIHKYKVEKEIAMTELKHPRSDKRTINNNFSVNKIDKSKSIHLHGHYHREK